MSPFPGGLLEKDSRRLRSRFRDSFVATRGKPPFFYGETTKWFFLLLRPLVALVFFAFCSSLSSANFAQHNNNKPSFPAHSSSVSSSKREREKEINSLSENAEDGEFEHEQRFLGLVLTPTQEQLSIQHFSRRIGRDDG